MQSETLILKPVTIDDKPLFDKFFREYDGINSEFTFTNMFMWRKSYNIRYAVVDGMLCVFSQHDNGAETVNIPLGCGDLKAVLLKLISYFEGLGQPPLIRLYKEAEKEVLCRTLPNTFVFTEDRNSYDYVYNVADLIELSGSRYHAKRNHINRFLSTYDYRYRRIDSSLLADCCDMFSRWCDNKEGQVPGISEQREAVSELFANIDALEVTGGCIIVDNKVAAFSVGEVLNSSRSVAVIHLEHANTDLQGSFPLINQQFLKNEWSNLELVNREEDMGLDGLRRAKKSYHPCIMVKKYIASML